MPPKAKSNSKPKKKPKSHKLHEVQAEWDSQMKRPLSSSSNAIRPKHNKTCRLKSHDTPANCIPPKKRPDHGQWYHYLNNSDEPYKNCAQQHDGADCYLKYNFDEGAYCCVGENEKPTQAEYRQFLRKIVIEPYLHAKYTVLDAQFDAEEETDVDLVGEICTFGKSRREKRGVAYGDKVSKKRAKLRNKHVDLMILILKLKKKFTTEEAKQHNKGSLALYKKFHAAGKMSDQTALLKQMKLPME